jgi:hypothetical protein
MEKNVLTPELEIYKGLSGTVVLSGMSVSVVVTDARKCYGRIDLRVEPSAGVGGTWVEHRKVLLDNPPIINEIVALAGKTIREQIAEASATRRTDI